MASDRSITDEDVQIMEANLRELCKNCTSKMTVAELEREIEDEILELKAKAEEYAKGIFNCVGNEEWVENMHASAPRG